MLVNSTTTAGLGPFSFGYEMSVVTMHRVAYWLSCKCLLVVLIQTVAQSTCRSARPSVQYRSKWNDCRGCHMGLIVTCLDTLRESPSKVTAHRREGRLRRFPVYDCPGRGLSTGREQHHDAGMGETPTIGYPESSQQN